ncbi:hypothetical protein HRbin23_00237 [bacterium HR23]|nr:hypothetical protein HRbin23_00237 [bacterium HR23]
MGRKRHTAQQLCLPGLFPTPTVALARPEALGVGKEVVYIGRVAGGPPRGSRGHVQRLTAWGAWVRFGKAGTWQVPLCLLAVPVAPSASTGEGTG